MGKANAIQLIVGLGNPGSQYESTRHNAGAWLVEAFCKHYRQLPKLEPKFHAKMALWSYGGEDCKIMIPTTYMNHSGQAVGAIAKYYQIPSNAILVVHDELDLPPGTVRLKTGGGHAGHNGLRDIIHHLQSREFHRIRIGIGHPGNKDEVVDYVLHRPSKIEESHIKAAISEAVRLLPQIVTGDWQTAIHQLHSFPAPELKDSKD